VAATRRGVTSGTVRLWTAAPTRNRAGGPFYEFISDRGKGGQGVRDLSELDCRVLYQAHLLSSAGSTIEEIKTALADMQAARWAGLPELPPTPEESRALTVPMGEVKAALEKQRGDYELRVMALTTERDTLAKARIQAQDSKAASDQ